MEILRIIKLIIAILCLTLFITATIVIVNSKRMTTFGKIWRIGLILILPLLGALEVLAMEQSRKKKEKERKRKMGA
jgi:hypothetical protein